MHISRHRLMPEIIVSHSVSEDVIYENEARQWPVRLHRGGSERFIATSTGANNRNDRFIAFGCLDFMCFQ